MKLDSCYGSVHQRHLYFTVQRAHCSHSDSTDTIEIEFTVCQCRHDCQLPAYKGILSHAAWPDMSICPSFSQHLTYRSNRRQTKGYWVMQPDQTCQSYHLSANIWLTGQTEDRQRDIESCSLTRHVNLPVFQPTFDLQVKQKTEIIQSLVCPTWHKQNKKFHRLLTHKVT